MKRFSLVILSLLIVFTGLVLSNKSYAKRQITKPTQLAVYHNNRGVKFLNEGNLDLAELEFKTAVELSPDYTEAYNNLGVVAKRKGDLNGAKEYFMKALKLDDNYGAAYSHLSMVYLDLGDLGNALSYGKIAAKRGSTMPITHYNLGIVYLEVNNQKPNKNYDKDAESELKIATELDPRMYEAHLALARLYTKQGRYELATIRYRLALQVKPFDAKVWNELGKAYQSMGQTTLAENAFKAAKEVSAGVNQPSTAPAPQTQNEKKNETGSKIEELKKLVASEPQNGFAHFCLGTAYLNLGDEKYAAGNKKEADEYYKMALPSLQKALELNPQLLDASYNIGYIYFRQGNLSAAEEQWNKTLSLNSGHVRTLYNLGMLYNQKGDKVKSTDFLCKFVAAAGNKYEGESQNALEIVKVNGGKCQN